MMTEPLSLILAGIAGGALGAMFFSGLWWTVRKGLSSKQPAILFLTSLILRTIIVLAGFHFVAAGHWIRLLAAFDIAFMTAGFLVYGLVLED